MINFNLKIQDQYAVVSFSLEEAVTPDLLQHLLAPDMVKENFSHKGVILSGRGPVWLYCFLTHFYHPTKFVATYDPRLQGAVVVESHGSDYKVGDVIPIDTSLITDKI